MLRKSFVSLLFVCLCSLLPPGARSQSVNGVIAGTIIDPSGAVVANAKLTITNTGTGITQSTTTGAAGEYRFALVPPGTYSIRIEASGFATEKAEGVVVQASQVVPFSLKLKVASAQQLIEVTGDNPLVQTESSDQTMQVDNTTIQNMALGVRAGGRGMDVGRGPGRAGRGRAAPRHGVDQRLSPVPAAGGVGRLRQIRHRPRARALGPGGVHREEAHLPQHLSCARALVLGLRLIATRLS